MRVAVVADMEGISAIVDPHEILAFARPYWHTGRRSMTSDVAAAARGLLRAGATEVVVVDSHGSGNEGNNMISKLLPEGARLENWTGADFAANDVDALLQVGFHARAGVDGFVSHTHVPGLRVRVDGELIGESHTTTWAADRPLLGIVGSDAHARTIGRQFREVPYLAVQRTSGLADAEPIFRDPADARAAIEDFAARVLQSGGQSIPRPTHFFLESSFPEDEKQAVAATAAGWEQRSETEYAVELTDWRDARQLLITASMCAFAAWLPYFTSFDLSSEAALDGVHDEPLLEEGRARFDDWLRQAHPEWLTPDGTAQSQDATTFPG